MVQPGTQGPQVSNDDQGPAPVRAWLSRGRLGDTNVIFCQLRVPRGRIPLAGHLEACWVSEERGGCAASSGLGGQGRAELEAGQQRKPGQEARRGAAAFPPSAGQASPGPSSGPRRG